MERCDSDVICTTPRSGSTRLCTLLAATGVAGDPDSHFHGASVAEWLADLGIDADPEAPERERLDAAFRAAFGRGRGEGGVFGLRVQRGGFDPLMTQLAVRHRRLATDAERFRAAFGRTRFVHLTRRDKVREAVSSVKARQTGLWHRAQDGTGQERLAPPRPPVDDAGAIAAALSEMAAHARARRRWFAASTTAPHRIANEAPAEAPRDVLPANVEHLGLDGGSAEVEPGVARLSDVIDRDRATRFRAERTVAEVLSR